MPPIPYAALSLDYSGMHARPAAVSQKRPVEAMASNAVEYVATSSGATAKSNLLTAKLAPIASGIPNNVPLIIRNTPCLAIIHVMPRLVAPSAMRTPISLVRRAVA